MHQIAPTLTTERLVLRPLRRSDFEPLAALYATDRSRYIDGPRPAVQVWRDLLYDAGQWSILGYGTWAVERRGDGACLGQVGINRPLDYPEDELGWLLFEGFEGQGYAFEAAARARAFAFETLGLGTLVSYIDPDNAPSIRLAERLGAVRDASARTPEGDACLVFRHPRP